MEHVKITNVFVMLITLVKIVQYCYAQILVVIPKVLVKMVPVYAKMGTMVKIAVWT